jgi:hypothetical protein
MTPPIVDSGARLRKLLGLTRDEPTITMEQLAELRSFPSGEAARKFLMRHKAYIATQKRGRRVVVTLRDFDQGCARLETDRAGTHQRTAAPTLRASGAA